MRQCLRQDSATGLNALIPRSQVRLSTSTLTTRCSERTCRYMYLAVASRTPHTTRHPMAEGGAEEDAAVVLLWCASWCITGSGERCGSLGDLGQGRAGLPYVVPAVVQTGWLWMQVRNSSASKQYTVFDTLPGAPRCMDAYGAEPASRSHCVECIDPQFSFYSRSPRRNGKAQGSPSPGKARQSAGFP